jgi:hypothetical protein
VFSDSVDLDFSDSVSCFVFAASKTTTINEVKILV